MEKFCLLFKGLVEIKGMVPTKKIKYWDLPGIGNNEHGFDVEARFLAVVFLGSIPLSPLQLSQHLPYLSLGLFLSEPMQARLTGEGMLQRSRCQQKISLDLPHISRVRCNYGGNNEEENNGYFVFKIKYPRFSQ
jgi:hypothetical protein